MNCPLCMNTEGHSVFEDDLLRVIEVPDAELPGSLRVIWKAHVQEFTDLTPEQRSHCMQVVCRAEQQIRDEFNPDKINLASFGNLVPHLHWHIMARWKTDPWWPQPTWAPRRDLQTLPTPPQIKGASKGQTWVGQLGDWQALQSMAAPIRFDVFVKEQNVPEEEEWDLADRYCKHVVIHDPHEPDPSLAGLATGRLLPDGRIGRMAVRREVRQSGLGGWVLQSLLREAKRLGMSQVLLHAQVHALGFYAQHGFTAEGTEFMECEMPHRQMRRDLADL